MLAVGSDKRCYRCERHLPLSEFNVDRARPDGLFPMCKPCRVERAKSDRAGQNERTKRWRKKNIERHRANTNRQKKAQGREHLLVIERRSRLKRKYGITLEEFDAMLEAQGGGCAICGGGPVSGREKHLQVDHDHKTGAVRALLCGNCNTGLGKFRDNPGLLEAALTYLSVHNGGVSSR